MPPSAPFAVMDTFASAAFTGSPTAAVLLPGNEWPADEALAKLALEFNHGETALLLRGFSADAERRAVGEDLDLAAAERFRLRWFRPDGGEDELCGHGTLASSSYLVLSGTVAHDATMAFETLSGVLYARAKSGDGQGRRGQSAELLGEQVTMEVLLPASPPAAVPEEMACTLADALGVDRAAVLYAGHTGLDDDFVTLGTRAEVAALKPDLVKVNDLGHRGLIVTAPEDNGDVEADFVSRAFFPTCGIPEDLITGSTHCSLGPYWAGELGKDELVGQQIPFGSGARGGYVEVRVVDQKSVALGGLSVVSTAGSILMPADTPA